VAWIVNKVKENRGRETGWDLRNAGTNLQRSKSRAGSGLSKINSTYIWIAVRKCKSAATGPMQAQNAGCNVDLGVGIQAHFPIPMFHLHAADRHLRNAGPMQVLTTSWGLFPAPTTHLWAASQ
ncbi:hypothetical protein HAX54_049403, partial [Datura stramonium]|nr:hypothetical protein [Datura stramonium]